MDNNFSMDNNFFIDPDDSKETLDRQSEDLIRILDGFASSNDSRLKIELSDTLQEGEIKRVYHHGRCDIGSPWACGNAFDAQTER